VLRTAAILDKVVDLPPVMALPGNHDWYDGLASFRRNFCESWVQRDARSGEELIAVPPSDQRDDVGGWGAFQSRSYFAVQLSPRWWLWAVDSQLDAPIDAEQLSYFRGARRHLGDAKVILCTATPSWLEAERAGTETYSAEADSPLYTLLWFIDRVLGHAERHRIRLVPHRRPAPLRPLHLHRAHPAARHGAGDPRALLPRAGDLRRGRRVPRVHPTTCRGSSRSRCGRGRAAPARPRGSSAPAAYPRRHDVTGDRALPVPLRRVAQRTFAPGADRRGRRRAVPHLPPALADGLAAGVAVLGRDRHRRRAARVLRRLGRQRRAAPPSPTMGDRAAASSATRSRTSSPRGWWRRWSPRSSSTRRGRRGTGTCSRSCCWWRSARRSS
jgi:hypothetical protein